MLPLAEQIEGIYFNKEEESLYINNVERMDPVGTAEYAKKADGEQVNPESVCSICTQSRSRIQLTQNRFKMIRFTKNQTE